MRILVPCLLLLGAAATAFAQAPAPQPVPKGQVLIELVPEQSIAEVVEKFARELGRPLLFNPNSATLRGKVGTSIRWQVSRAGQLEAVRAVLAMWGLQIAEVGPTNNKLLLLTDTRTTTPGLRNAWQYVDAADLPAWSHREGEPIVTVLRVPGLRHASGLRGALQILASNGVGRMLEDRTNGTIVVADFAPRVAQMAQVAARVNEEARAPAPTFDVIELQHANASHLARTVEHMLKDTHVLKPIAGERRGLGELAFARPRLSAVPGRNAVMLLATQEDAHQLRELIAQLDKPTPKPVATPRELAVVPLSHVRAVDVAVQLRAALQGRTAVQATLHPVVGNRLLVSATAAHLARVRALLTELDVPPANAAK